MKASDHTPRGIAPARVLFKKFPLATTISALAMASMIVLGGALSAEAATYYDLNVDGSEGYAAGSQIVGSKTEATGVTMTVTGGTDMHRVYAVNQGSVDVYDNVIEVSGGTFKTKGTVSLACAGSAGTHNAYNLTKVRDVSMDDAYGGLSSSASAYSNRLELTGDVIITDAAVGGCVNGGNANSENNTILYKGSENSSVLYLVGTRVRSAPKEDGTGGDGIGNIVTMESGNALYMYGASVEKGGDAISNTVVMTGGIAGHFVGGASSSGEANKNTVNITGGTVTGTLYGGQGYTAADGNTITVAGTADMTEAALYGGYSDAEDEGSASSNTILMEGGTASDIIGGYSTGGEANSNSITITGGKVIGTIYGGIGTAADGNYVTLSGSPDLEGATLYGGYRFAEEVMPSLEGDIPAEETTGSTPSKAPVGNTLHVKTLDLTAKNIHGFENYKFTLPSTVKNGDIALKLTDTAGTDLGADPKVDVVIEAGAPLVIEGGRADLIRNEKGGLEYSGKLVLAPLPDSPLSEGDTPAEDATPVATVTARQGVSLEYDLIVGTDEHNLYVEAPAPQPEEPVQPEAPAPVPPVQPAVRVNPQTKSLLEGRIASLAFVNQGADLIAGRGIAAAREASLEGELVPFMIGEAGKSRYQTGSHVDVRGFSMIAGLTYGKKTEIGDAALAAFFEGGWGNYDSHNSFHNAASVRGDGNNKYYGGGMLAHMAFPDLGPGNVYAEATFRAGWADTDYSSGDLRDAFGNQAAYTSGAAYWGAHVGLGYEWKLSDSSLLDFYAKYFWTHHTGDSVNVVGDPIDFGSSNSHRSRFGARYTKEIVSDGMVFKPFVGAAYEYEFNGKASGTTYGFAMDEPALRGGTGMGEVGMTFKPAEDSDFELDLSLQGYTGTREGVAGTFTLKYKF